jgi:hypothetical protein
MAEKRGMNTLCILARLESLRRRRAIVQDLIRAFEEYRQKPVEVPQPARTACRNRRIARPRRRLIP